MLLRPRFLFRRRSCAALALVLAGCAGTSMSVQQAYAPATGDRFAFQLVPQADIGADALVLLDLRLKARLVDRASTGTANRNAEIVVTRYITRKPVGVEEPADEIESRITVRDAQSGAVVGAFVVDSKNPGTWRTTGVLLDQHADRIAATLRGR